MLKISIVMLTTAGFAALLIADPYGPMVSAARRTVVAANVQAAPASQRPEPSPVAKPVEQSDPVVQEAPAIVAAVASKTEAADLTVTPTRPQLAGGFPGLSDKRDRDRPIAHRYLHLASVNNVVHHVRRHG
jgi:hypothetical protein